jgi:hypothetical protein
MRSSLREVARRSLILSCIVGGLFLAACSSFTSELADTTASAMSAQVSTCSASDLEGTGGWQGATQTMLGALWFRNVSKSPCTLRGFVRVEFLNQHGQDVEAQTRHGVSSAASGVTHDVRTILLRPGRPDQAEVPFQFSCQGAVPVVRRVRVVLPDGTTLNARSGGSPWTVEACSPDSGPSVLSEGPIQAQPT